MFVTMAIGKLELLVLKTFALVLTVILEKEEPAMIAANTVHTNVIAVTAAID